MLYEPTKTEHTNVLPPNCQNWLQFYDGLPEDLRNEPKTKTRIVGERGDMDFYLIEREYMLARVAEELLPSRYSRNELHALTLALHEGSKYTTTGIPNEHSFLKRAWEVARR
jgi:hypothetical protein